MVMSQIQGTNVAAAIAPFDTLDTYPTHDAQYGKGGYRSVATVVERDAIPTARRTTGMRVRVTTDPSPVNNNDWDWIGGTWVAAPGVAAAIAAEESRIAAEVAEGNAHINADVYDTIAEGIVATIVGEQFQVPSADEYFYQRYRHDTGGVATSVGPPLPTVLYHNLTKESLIETAAACIKTQEIIARFHAFN